MNTTPLKMLACVSLLSLLAACGNPNKGYYDANGNYIPTHDTPHNTAERNHSPMPGGVDYPAEAARSAYYGEDYAGRPHYTRRGYYDYNGYYVERDTALAVPADMFPPRGMCRVWFVDRPYDLQPGIENCEGIRSRVPDGAYVIYGG